MGAPDSLTEGSTAVMPNIGDDALSTGQVVWKPTTRATDSDQPHKSGTEYEARYFRGDTWGGTLGVCTESNGWIARQSTDHKEL